MTMRAIVDIRKVHLRGSERILMDISEEFTGRTVSMPPQPVDMAFDNLQVTLLDMLERNRESGATPIVRVDSEAPTALIPKTKIK